ncbi:MAG: hypothetical protein LDLANPLL_02476 [Turneriella sp.]|nr:hypothetical protein [Turneriella sp.]
MNTYTLRLLLVLTIPIAFMRSGCYSTTNDAAQRTQAVEYYIGIGGNPSAKAKLLNVIDSAQTEIVGMFNDLADTDIASALIQKANAGLKVAIGGDRRNEASAGFAQLAAKRPQMFQTYFDATAAAANEPNVNLKKNILRTRLNFNRNTHPTKLRYAASSYDGRVEYNFVVADKTTCWVSTGGANAATFSTGLSVVFVFHSFDICNDFYNEAQQGAYGGLFGDEGEPSFGKFRFNKTITDPNTRFRLGDLIFNIYFAPQEYPQTAVVTELLRAEKSIQFAVRAMTQDIIFDVSDHTANRSHLLNAFQYKSTIPKLYGNNFSIDGVFGTEVDAAPTPLTTPWTAAAQPYNALVSDNCPTTNTAAAAGLKLPFYDGSSISSPGSTYCHAGGTSNLTGPGCASATALMNVTSIHCDMASLMTTVGDASVVSVKKLASPIPYNVFLTDYGARRPRLIVMSSDLRKRYYYDKGGSQDVEPKRTRDDFFLITDAVVMVIEPAGSQTNTKIFDDFKALIDKLIQVGGAL